MEIHPTTVLIAGALIVGFMSASPRAKAWDNPRRDPAVHEAQAARQEARQGRLRNNADEAQRERNRYARCDVHTGDDRALCIRRMNGEGIVTGSYEGGGILRELTVTVPAE